MRSGTSRRSVIAVCLLVVATLLISIGGAEAQNAALHDPATASQTPVGKSAFELQQRVGTQAKPMRVHLYRPRQWTVKDRILFVMHGRQRDGARYRDQWIAEADRYDFLIVVPEFDESNFPGTASYNWGNVVDKAGKPLPPAAWSFGVIDTVFAAVRQRTGASRQKYALYGHSAGAQFTHRLLLLSKSRDAAVIVTANSGSYTMPIPGVGFPFGLAGIAVNDFDLRRAFARPVVVLLGEADTDANAKSLPRQPGAVAQGPNRLARGERFFATARARAAALRTSFYWQLATVPGVGHSNSGMARKAAEIIARRFR